MEESFINIVNVCDIAKLLNELDGSFIKPSVCKDAHLFIEDFKVALEHFNNPLKDKIVAQYSPVLFFDKHLAELMKAPKNLYSILTEEGKIIIKEKLSKKQKESVQNS